MEVFYSRAAILIRVPPFLERPETVRPKYFTEGIEDTDAKDDGAEDGSKSD